MTGCQSNTIKSAVVWNIRIADDIQYYSMIASMMLLFKPQFNKQIINID